MYRSRMMAGVVKRKTVSGMLQFSVNGQEVEVAGSRQVTRRMVDDYFRVV